METDDPRVGSASPLPPDLQSFLATVLTVLSTLSVPHCLIGAAALGAWGRPRATHDLDLLILVDKDSKERLLARLSASGITVNQPWQEANPMAQTRVTRFVSQSHPGYPLDLIYASDRHEHEALTRTRTVLLHGLSLSVVSPEDLMIPKLKAGGATEEGEECVRDRKEEEEAIAAVRPPDVCGLEPDAEADVLRVAEGLLDREAAAV